MKHSILLATVSSLILASPWAQAQEAPQSDETTFEDTTTDTQVEPEDEVATLATVSVIGSRGRARTDVDRPVPVDVVSAPELAATGQTDLAQQLQFTSPSFNSQKYGVNGATNFADPASLRGLAPDQTLVLVNGKRRHQFSALNLNVAPGLGTVVTDLNSIPTAAVGRIEVLRDGAAAQYGSDAIAGIINLTLKDSPDEGSISVTSGINEQGDGFTIKAALNNGISLGQDQGFLNFTLEHFSTDGTNRSDPYTGSLYPATPADYAVTGPTVDFPYSTATPRADRGFYPQTPFVVGRYGSNENQTYQAFVNSAYSISDDVEVYAFGGYSSKEITAYGFFRAPSTFGNASLGIFPDGYVPILPGKSVDYSFASGIRGELAGWDLDLSYVFGHNQLDQYARNTVNASLGEASPTEFYVGQTAFEQQTVDLSASKNYGAMFGLENLNVATGVQWRKDNFAVTRGSPESYAIGPLAATGKATGSNGRPGYAPDDETDIDRTNVGAYLDIEADVTEDLLFTTAVRYENYSDFGGNLSGKLAARYKLTDSVSVRGSYNRGFRAPSLAQVGNSVTTSTVQNNQILQTKQIASADPRLALLGVPDPEAEVSDNISLGLTGDFGQVLGGSLSGTLDIFQIDIKDRIAITERLVSANYPAVAAAFPGIREIRFFTNQIDTETQGIDAVLTYKRSLGEGDLSFTLAGTHVETSVVDQRETPAALIAGASQSVQDRLLVGQTAIELIEVAQPRTKVVMSGNYSLGNWSFLARGTYFGDVKAFSTGLSDVDGNVECDANNRCVQTFSDKTIVDLSATYTFENDLTLSVGANNIFDTYPDKWNNLADGAAFQASSYSNGQTPYTRNAGQFGFNGAYYYISATKRF